MSSPLKVLVELLMHFLVGQDTNALWDDSLNIYEEIFTSCRSSFNISVFSALYEKTESVSGKWQCRCTLMSNKLS
jgi:hypothetical protein